MEIDNIDTGISNYNREVNNDNNQVLEENKSNQALLGKKTKSSIKGKKHNIFSSDNIFRKIKCYFINYLFTFINSVIKTKYGDNIGYDIFQKKLLNIDKKEILSSKGDKKLLGKTLKEIFSEDKSLAYSKNYNKNHNKELIDQLLNEEDEEKRVFFNKLFSLTFIKCFRHFRGSETIEELNGLSSSNDFLKKYENNEDYKNNLNYYIEHFEELIERKRNIKDKNKIESEN